MRWYPALISATSLDKVDLMGITTGKQKVTYSPLVPFLSLKSKSLGFTKDVSSTFILKTVLI